jgi:hypothetical protein
MSMCLMCYWLDGAWFELTELAAGDLEVLTGVVRDETGLLWWPLADGGDNEAGGDGDDVESDDHEQGE